MAESPVALITGSGRHRVGNCIARELAGAGHRIAIHYHHSEESARRTVEELTAAGVDARAFAADLRDEPEVIGLVANTLVEFGRLDVLVCAAAVWQPASLEATTASDLRRQWEINSLSTFLGAKYAGLAMARQPTGGCIVTIGDWATCRPYTDYSAYLASKGSIPTITRTLAVELAERNRNIRVNCILPGPVMLPAELTAEERQAVIDSTLLKREGRPENVAQAVRFFVENDFVTGVCLPVDGGRSIHAGGL